MNFGPLRHRITIQKATLGAADAYGQPAQTWGDYATRWASINPLSGRELDYARSIAATATHRINLRYIEGVDTLCRVLFYGREFSVNAVLTPDEVKRETHIYATEILQAIPS